MPFIRVAMAQINTTVGDYSGNAEKIVSRIHSAEACRAHLVIFPEMSISGYPPEDLLYKQSFVREGDGALKKIVSLCRGNIVVIIGFVESTPLGLYNSIAVVRGKKVLGVYRKNRLPNYGVFDEKRYFIAGSQSLTLNYAGIHIGLSICEDIWDPKSFVYSKDYAANVDIIVNGSASPYHAQKYQEREQLLKRVARLTQSWVLYNNLVGGQDELVFDGGGMIVSPQGQLKARQPLFIEDLLLADIPMDGMGAAQRVSRPPGNVIRITKPQMLFDESVNPFRIADAKLSATEEVYRALVCGTQDYFFKNRFSRVVVGLSGGIDSALVAAIAVDALGPERVFGVTMPSPYTSKSTLADAERLAKNLGIPCLKIRIKPLMKAYADALATAFKGKSSDITEENLQARIRGNILMALSNKLGHLVLATGNKSEMATGYCTLYGDMAGGFAVIKDVPKTLVFDLCRWRNTLSKDAIIPPSIISRPPSAELRPHQKDEDSLPPYSELDPIINAFVEKDLSAAQIIASGSNKKHVLRALSLIERSEYKRRQSPPGIKITPRAFGRDRRLPITNRFSETRDT